MCHLFKLYITCGIENKEYALRCFNVTSLRFMPAGSPRRIISFTGKVVRPANYACELKRRSTRSPLIMIIIIALIIPQAMREREREREGWAGGEVINRRDSIVAREPREMATIANREKRRSVNSGVLSPPTSR